MKLDKPFDDTLPYKKMKKIYPLILALLFFFLFTFPVRAARNEATQGAATGVGQTVRQEKIATIEARLNTRKKEIIRNHFLRMTKRLEAAINRLNRLITRIESRIAKIEANNKDINTEPIKKDIQKAKDKLLLATNKLNEAKIKIDGLLESNTPKETFTEVRNMIQEIKKDLVEVHRLLVKVIGDIKGLRVGNSATPSAETE
jgi:septal ring factor EnvC (AmiA/AmiB activator)